jgi:hypothetical protein
MTYLDLVNNVLFRLREKPASTVYQQSDAVVNMIKSLVNDAKRHVEGSHRWTALETTWYIENRSLLSPTPKGDVAPLPEAPESPDDNWMPPFVADQGAQIVWSFNDYALPGTRDGCSITNVFNEKGGAISQTHPDQLHKWRMMNPEQKGHAQFYSVVSQKDQAGYAIRVWPRPRQDITVQDRLTVKGYRTTGDMKKDDDVLLVPSQPVLYYALALAARERGEVGGQTAQELFAMAANYISDSIATDFNVTPFNNTWVAV